MKHKASDSNLDFDGMAGNGVNRRSGSTSCANRFSLGAKADSINKGKGPTKGNASSSAMNVGPSATKDPHKLTIATAKGGKINGGAARKPFGGAPDKINVGNK